MRARPHVLRNRKTGEVKAHLSIRCDEAKFYANEEFHVTCQDVAGGFEAETHVQLRKGKPPKVDRVEVKRVKKPKTTDRKRQAQ